MDKPKTETQFIAELLKLKEMRGGDHEAIHAGADDLLVRVIRQNGYNLLADEYASLVRWCA